MIIYTLFFIQFIAWVIVFALSIRQSQKINKRQKAEIQEQIGKPQGQFN